MAIPTHTTTGADKKCTARKIETMRRISEQLEKLADEMADFSHYYNEAWELTDKVLDLNSEVWEQFARMYSDFLSE